MDFFANFLFLIMILTVFLLPSFLSFLFKSSSYQQKLNLYSSTVSTAIYCP